MHPPWITTFFFLIFFATTGTSSAEGEKGDDDNSTMARKQRETYERERRLIPYMTYYLAPSPGTRTSPEARGILVPVATPRENVYQIHAFPKIPVPAIQNDDSQQIQILPKPQFRVQSPSLLPSTIQAGKQEGNIIPQIYDIRNQYADPGITGPSIGPQAQVQRIQSESRPLQIIKLNPPMTEQKFTAPQLIKVIPIITKLSSAERSLKPFLLPPRQFGFATHRVPSDLPQSYTFNDHNYYKDPPASQNENSFQGNILYATHNPPDKNKYTLAKIALASTTPSPYHIQFKVTPAPTPVTLPNANELPADHFTRLNPVVGEGSHRGQLSTIPSGRQQVPYLQNTKPAIQQEPQDLLQTQNSYLPKLRVPLEEKITFVATVTPIPVTNDLENTQWKTRAQVQGDPKYDNPPLNSISSLLKETSKLPQNLTPHNIDAGIKTLALILERLQQHQRNQQSIHQPSQKNTSISHQSPADNHEGYKKTKKVHSFPEKSGTSTPGRPGIDYPIYSSIPQTNFDCSTQRYKGFFGDPDTNCQVWHYCDLNGGQASFLCPNGTIFSQVALTCDWWFNVKCASTSQLYVLNERLYKYILPFSPSFPEDFSGPIVDTYLEAKFKEMEAKSRKKGGKSTNSTTTAKPEVTTEISTDGPTELDNEYQTPAEEI